jgi:FkbM family methyltransferase
MLLNLSLEELRREFMNRSAKLAQNTVGILPDWLQNDGLGSLSKYRFFVCGSVCRAEIKILARLGTIEAIVDDFICERTHHLDGFKVIDSEAWIEAARLDPAAISVILVPGARAYQYFTRQCLQFGLRNLGPVEFIYLLKQSGLPTFGEPGRFLIYGYEFFSHVFKNADKLVKLCDRLEDDYSKISWMAILLYRITLNPVYLESVAVGHNSSKFSLNSYGFNSQFFTLTESEVYVDGGAFNGDTVEQFSCAVRGRFKEVFAFEPSVSQFPEIHRRIQRISSKYPDSNVGERIHLVEKGLWDREGVLHFVAGMAPGADGSMVNPQSGHFVETQIISHLIGELAEKSHSIVVPVTSVDQVTEGRATLIKLEIEGSELKALQGSRDTIQRNRPNMAISIYHKPEDLITITEFVDDTDQGYRLGFRQHNSLCPDAMVLYCAR